MKHLANTALIILLSSWIGTAFAEPAHEACTALMSARAHLLAFIGATNKTTRENHYQKIMEATEKVDAIVAGMISGFDERGSAQAKEFGGAWEAFKRTRDTEIIPASLAGEHRHSLAIATGIQTNRMKQMLTAMACQ